jgi:hypothetical protein
MQAIDLDSGHDLSELYVPARAIVAINAIQVQIFLISKWTKKMQSP